MNIIERRTFNRRTGDLLAVFSAARHINRLFCCAAVLAMAVALVATGAYAQSHQDLEHPAPPSPATNRTPEVVDPNVTAGPTIYITDTSGRLATVTLGTYAVHVIGYEGVVLTDIGFSPVDGQLYGLSFTKFYKVNKTTGKATFVGNLGISDANALVFNGQGVPYTEGTDSSELYKINVKTGHVTAVGSTAPFKSAGDLTFYNGGLVLSGFYQSSLGSTTPDTLVLLNPTTAKPLGYAELKLANLFGIVCTGKDVLYGFSGTSVYQLFPSQSNITKRAVLLKSLSGKGIASIYGAAYDGYFLY